MLHFRSIPPLRSWTVFLPSPWRTFTGVYRCALTGSNGKARYLKRLLIIIKAMKFGVLPGRSRHSYCGYWLQRLKPDFPQENPPFPNPGKTLFDIPFVSAKMAPQTRIID